jgi:monoterpene epsilon-lactone hydrolase
MASLDKLSGSSSAGKAEANPETAAPTVLSPQFTRLRTSPPPSPFTARALQDRSVYITKKPSTEALAHNASLLEIMRASKSKIFAPMPEADDRDGWRAENDKRVNSTFNIGLNTKIIETYDPTIEKLTINGIPTIDIKPQGWKDNGKILVFLHGGGHSINESEKYLYGAVPLADAGNFRIISVDYTKAPFAQFQEIIDEIVNVLEGLTTKHSYSMKDIGLYGDSSGGGLAMGTVLKMRDAGKDLPAALAAWSGWFDLTRTSESHITRQNKDHILQYENGLKNCALAYAGEGNLKHPFASPVYADFHKQDWPATLLQVGSDEILFGDSKRFLARLAKADKEASLQIYSGVSHVFQVFAWELPESKRAIRETAGFFKEKLTQTFL